MNAFVVRYARAALTDIQEAFDYYERQQSGLGAGFTTAVLNKIEAIALNPDHATIRYDQVRCTSVEGFPYLIHYSKNDEAIEVIFEAVWNTYRRPLCEQPGIE